MQWRVNLFLYKIFSWKISHFYLFFWGKLYFFLNRKEKREIENAIKTVFLNHHSASEIKSIIRRVFRGIFFHYYEKFFNIFCSPEISRSFFKTHVTSEGMASIRNGLAKGKGVLLITGHFGGIEFIPGYLAVNNYPVTILAKFSSEHFRDLSIQKAEKFAIRIIDAGNTSNIMKAIFNSLRQNRIVITECDEIDEWRPSYREKTKFLGKQINLDRTINVLSKRGGASIVLGIMRRNNNQRYRFIVQSLEDMEKRFQPLIGMPAGALILKALEQYILHYPEEWYQWKNYHVIGTSSIQITRAKIPKAASLAMPTLNRIS